MHTTCLFLKPLGRGLARTLIRPLQINSLSLPTHKKGINKIAYTLSFYSLVLSPFIFACLEYTRIKNIKNVTRCRDSRSAKSIETR